MMRRRVRHNYLLCISMGRAEMGSGILEKITCGSVRARVPSIQHYRQLRMPPLLLPLPLMMLLPLLLSVLLLMLLILLSVLLLILLLQLLLLLPLPLPLLLMQ